MRRMARFLALALAITPFMVTAGGAEGEGRVECLSASGVDPATADALCHALRAEQPRDPLRLHILATGPAALSARLEVMTDQGPRPGPALQFSVMDRDLSPGDYRSFARDLLRFGQPQP